VVLTVVCTAAAAAAVQLTALALPLAALEALLVMALLEVTEVLTAALPLAAAIPEAAVVAQKTNPLALAAAVGVKLFASKERKNGKLRFSKQKHKHC
jgi:hypothetical protein